MSRSSSDVFDDIASEAEFASTAARNGLFTRAASYLEEIECLVADAKHRLQYEIECKREALQ